MRVYIPIVTGRGAATIQQGICPKIAGSSMRNAVALPALACLNAQHLFCLVVVVQMVWLAQHIIVPVVGRIIRHKKYVRAAQQVEVTVLVHTHIRQIVITVTNNKNGADAPFFYSANVPTDIVIRRIPLLIDFSLFTRARIISPV